MYIQPHMKMPTASGTIQGGINRMRNSARPGRAAFISAAPQMPIAIFSATEKKVQTKVRRITAAKCPAKILL